MNWQLLLAILPDILKLVGQIQQAMPTAPSHVKKALVMAPLAMAPLDVHAAVGKFVDDVVAATKLGPAPVMDAVAPATRIVEQLAALPPYPPETLVVG